MLLNPTDGSRPAGNQERAGVPTQSRQGKGFCQVENTNVPEAHPQSAAISLVLAEEGHIHRGVCFLPQETGIT